MLNHSQLDRTDDPLNRIFRLSKQDIPREKPRRKFGWLLCCKNTTLWPSDNAGTKIPIVGVTVVIVPNGMFVSKRTLSKKLQVCYCSDDDEVQTVAENGLGPRVVRKLDRECGASLLRAKTENSNLRT